jgi:hypothetical protein
VGSGLSDVSDLTHPVIMHARHVQVCGRGRSRTSLISFSFAMCLPWDSNPQHRGPKQRASSIWAREAEFLGEDLNLRQLAPQASASANCATQAIDQLLHTGNDMSSATTRTRTGNTGILSPLPLPLALWWHRVLRCRIKKLSPQLLQKPVSNLKNTLPGHTVPLRKI